MSPGPFFGLWDAQLYYLATRTRPPGLSELISIASLHTPTLLWHHWTGRRRGQGGLSAGMLGWGLPQMQQHAGSWNLWSESTSLWLGCLVSLLIGYQQLLKQTSFCMASRPGGNTLTPTKQSPGSSNLSRCVSNQSRRLAATTGPPGESVRVLDGGDRKVTDRNGVGGVLGGKVVGCKCQSCTKRTTSSEEQAQCDCLLLVIPQQWRRIWESIPRYPVQAIGNLITALLVLSNPLWNSKNILGILTPSVSLPQRALVIPQPHADGHPFLFTGNKY